MRKFLIYSLFLFCNLMNAQVTIGSGEAPVKGSALQIKTIIGNGLENSTLGLALPRVSLTDENELYPMFDEGYDKAIEDSKHIGLMVYNTNATDRLAVGLYMWDGSRWNIASSGAILLPSCTESVNITFPTTSVSRTVFQGLSSILSASYTGYPLDLKWQKKDRISNQWVDLINSRTKDYPITSESDVYRFAILDCLTNAWIYSEPYFITEAEVPNPFEYSIPSAHQYYLNGINCFDTRENFELKTSDGQNGKESSRQITDARPKPIGEFSYTLVVPSNTSLSNVVWVVEDEKGFLSSYSVETNYRPNDKLVINFMDWEVLTSRTADGRLASSGSLSATKQVFTITVYFTVETSKYKVSKTVKVQDFFCCDGLIIQGGAFDYADGTPGDWAKTRTNVTGSGNTTLIGEKLYAGYTGGVTTLGYVTEYYNNNPVSDICWYKNSFPKVESGTTATGVWAESVSQCATGGYADGDYPTDGNGWYLPNVREFVKLMEVLPNDSRSGFTNGKYGDAYIFGGSSDATGLGGASNIAYYTSDELSANTVVAVFNSDGGSRISVPKVAVSGNTYNILFSRCVRRF